MIDSVTKYLEAIRLEYHADSLYHAHFRIQGAAQRIPHGFAILKYISRYERLIAVAVPPLIVLWCLLLQPLYAVFMALRWSLQLRRVEVGPISDNLYLASSNERNFCFVSPNDADYPSAILTLPFKRAIKKQAGHCRYVDLRAISGAGVLFRAASYSMLASLSMLLSAERRLALYTYTAFSWFWVYLALERNEVKTVWISNHYDRWTMLASLLPDVNVILVQHGRLYHALKNGNRLVLSRTQKIKNVKRIYALDEESEMYFRKYIEDANLEFVRLRLATELMEWRKAGAGKFKILIVGNSGDLRFHNQLISQLLDRHAKDADLAYRYHPLQTKRIPSDLGDSVWELVSSDCVPKVDLVVSYGSSLDEEVVALTGAQILHYDWDVNIDVESIVREIETRMKVASSRPKRMLPAR